jgi:tol-pal system protein YbgF
MGLGLFIVLMGCSRGKIRALEDQVAQTDAQNTALQTEVATLEADLDQAQTANQNVQKQLDAKDQIIAQQEEDLSDLRFENLELKAASEERGALSYRKAELSGDYEADYDRALGLFNERWYIEAAYLFRELIESDRSHPLADNSQYWLGECYYALKQFENAIAEFEKVFAFPQSNKSDAALLKIGLCWLQLDKNPEAREQLIRLLSSYPDSEYVSRARDILDQIP